jgi:hypothetical protein
MALAKLVQDVNASFKAQHADAVAHRENPRMIHMLKTLIRLTNTEDDNAKEDKEAEAAKAALPKCPHDVVNRKTGKCVACGEIPEDEE